MIFARALCRDRPADLELAFLRMALPRAAGEYLLEKLPHRLVLVTGLGRPEGSFLRRCAEASVAPGREEFPFYSAGDQQLRPGTALLAGRQEHFDRLLAASRREEGLAPLSAALDRLLSPSELPAPLRLGARSYPLGRRTYLMGVLNVTPDSFSDGGRFFEPKTAIARGEALARSGADLVDVGGESTRPGASEVTEEEELRRVLPVIQGLAQAGQVPISIDTSKAEVARQALAAGATLVNDVSGLSHDPRMGEVIAQAGAACCLMHLKGTPATMQVDPQYDDVVEEVLEALLAAKERALAAGVKPDRILLDPGIGFGKTLAHNLFLLRRLADLRCLGQPLVVGTSRKSFLGKLGGTGPSEERVIASVASAAAIASSGGADFLRVHDLAQTREAVAVAEALRDAQGGGALFLPRGKGLPSNVD